MSGNVRDVFTVAPRTGTVAAEIPHSFDVVGHCDDAAHKEQPKAEDAEATDDIQEDE